MPAHVVAEFFWVVPGQDLRLTGAILHSLDAGDAIAPVVPDEPRAPLKEILLLLALLVLPDFSLSLQ
eukprot:CAMPEP_0185599044 /NCGR_PEP_ID=MMETSP0434-20130131/82419_1 /TAXON_ID=626734 ORGANISM="Favella taraikaensis, Strain Fe Narragansett Bay" /NCGR_SAMPLE_ID=MMETSP0434 /ASSEMBLY_ACC=CAM_ASM_000379 /LENGTH=66 /DNA_ID=CAMNT_0028228267 /DNA_START=397 /DNA_END=597 /DNA_ORIENTATION=+